jgi:general stress protein 26
MNRILISGGSLAVGILIGIEHKDKFHFALQKVKNISLLNTNVSDSCANATTLMKKAESISNSCKFAVLSTLKLNNNGISSRAVQPFELEYDENGNPEIYFNTNKLTRKFEEMNASSHVNLTYLNETTMSCVNYSGIVERVPYPQSTRHWRSWLIMFYPEGPNEDEGSRFTTWRVRPNKITVISYVDGISSARNDGRPPEINYNFSTQKWDLICNGKE